MKTTISIISLLLIIAGLGCASLSALVTPASLDTKAIDYATEAQTIEPATLAGYKNLDKAIRLENAVDDAHEVNQLMISQMMEKDQLDYAQLNDIVVQNRMIGQKREEMLFAEDGLLTLGLSMAGFGSLTGLIGLMRKRPQDLTPEEVEKAYSGLQGELSDKDRQLIELIKGVQDILNTTEGKDNNLLGQFKLALGNAQSTDTKVKVAEIKATL